MDTLIDNLPPLIEEGKICYCESGGSLIYRPAGSEEHPSVLHLPVPEIKELQRRTKQSDKANQFLDSPDEVDSLTQFKLTIDSDGIIPALRGLMLYNSYSVSARQKWSDISQIILSNLPSQLNSILSSWYQKEIPHEDADGLVSSFDWHPRIDKLAVALKDDSIKIFYPKNNLIPLLKHKRQVGINIIRWKPLVEDILGVGCQDCCIIWTIDPNSMSARPGSGCAQVISSPADQPIHSLSWDPNSCLLGLASKKSSKLEIWDSDREELIYRKSGLTPISKVLFNTNGERLLICGQKTITVFQCCNWKAETWSNLEDTVHHAAWSQCGNHLIFATKNKLFCIGFNTIIGGESEAKLLYAMQFNISSLVWSNDRLAVGFDTDETNSVLLLNTQLKPSGHLRADINGWLPSPEKVSLMAFKSFKYGSMLSIVNPSGKFNNIPFLYLNMAGKQSHYDANKYVNDTLGEIEEMTSSTTLGAGGYQGDMITTSFIKFT